MRNDRDNLIVGLTLEFALAIVEYASLLEKENKFVVSRQIIKSGTSIGANVREAQNSESRSDFIHKFKVAAKEADETHYWLVLCKRSESYPDPPLILLENLTSIIRIISKIISTSKGR